jgi:hypothetical protein
MVRAFCLLLLFSFPVCGQISSIPTRGEVISAAPPTRYAATDTVVALHRLFTNQRVGGAALLGASVIPLIGTPAISVATSEPGGYKPLAAFINGIVLGVVISAPVAYLGGHQLSRYSKAKEEQTISQYREMHVLPRKIEKKLRAGLFLPPELYAPRH